MRLIPWLITVAILALLVPTSSRAVEVLVLTTPTEVAYAGEAYEVQNLGPEEITCQRGSGDGLTLGKGRVIGRRETVRIAGAFQKLFCIARVAQVSGAATIVTPGIANTGSGVSFDPSSDTTLLVHDPSVGTTVFTIPVLAKRKDTTVWSKCSSDCYGTFGPETLTSTGTTGFPLPGGDTNPRSFGYGAAIGPLKLVCKTVGCPVHVDQSY